MAKICYYVAQSIDGFISDINDSVEWLESFPVGETVQLSKENSKLGDEQVSSLFDYDKLIQTVDVVCMGRKTFDFLTKIKTNIYHPRPCYVVSRNKDLDAHRLPGDVRLVPSPSNFADWARSQVKDIPPGRRMFFVGGGALAGELAREGLLHELIITTLPIMLGHGARLFDGNGVACKVQWSLKAVGKTTGGCLQSYYVLKEE